MTKKASDSAKRQQRRVREKLMKAAEAEARTQAHVGSLWIQGARMDTVPPPALEDLLRCAAEHDIVGAIGPGMVHLQKFTDVVLPRLATAWSSEEYATAEATLGLESHSSLNKEERLFRLERLLHDYSRSSVILKHSLTGTCNQTPGVKYDSEGFAIGHEGEGRPYTLFPPALVRELVGCMQAALRPTALELARERYRGVHGRFPSRGEEPQLCARTMEQAEWALMRTCAADARPSDARENQRFHFDFSRWTKRRRCSAVSSCIPLLPGGQAGIDVDTSAWQHVCSTDAPDGTPLEDIMDSYQTGHHTVARHTVRFGHSLTFMGSCPHRGQAFGSSNNMRGHCYWPAEEKTPDNSVTLYKAY